ncbi:hypothetical protein BJ170DRAFT_591840 [Xylariales sp. AK1849]|nr:hypothetical protein BJ170DRAFT_591840 [Xylariales sp. AK1849]
MSSGYTYYEGVMRAKSSPYDGCARGASYVNDPEGCLQLEAQLEALAHHNIPIEHLRAGTLSWRFFERDPKYLLRLFKPLAKLTYIDLVLTTRLDENLNDIDGDNRKCRQSLRNGIIKDLLATMPDLETLVFAIRPICQTWIVERAWIMLSELELSGIECDRRSLTKFLERHKETLRTICLQDIHLAKGSWKRLLPDIRSKLYLHDACICGRLTGCAEDETSLDEAWHLWYREGGPVDMRSSINYYCRRGGEVYPNELPLTKQVVRKYFDQYVWRPGVKTEAEDAAEMRRCQAESQDRIRDLGLFRHNRRQATTSHSGDEDLSSDSEEEASDGDELEAWETYGYDSVNYNNSDFDSSDSDSSDSDSEDPEYVDGGDV